MSTWTMVRAILPDTPDDWSAWTYTFERHDLIGTLQEDQPPALSAYVAPGNEHRISALREDLMQQGAVGVEETQVEEQDWAEAWKQFFKPRLIGRRILVRPTWELADVGPEDIEVVLDPGQAFGTGDHPTTRGCVVMLEKVVQHGDKVADIGCGSGILSIVAAKLGAGDVHAVDSDPVSVQATEENARINSVKVGAFTGLGFTPLPDDEVYNLVVSNIISSAIIQIASEASLHIMPGGHWIISGIIEANWPDVEKAVRAVGFDVVNKELELEWVTALLRH